MKPPAVYPSINRVAAHFAKFGIAKSAMNLVDGYDYRSIDDVVAAVSPLLAKHRLCVLPKVVERVASSRRGVDSRRCAIKGTGFARGWTCKRPHLS